MGLKIAIDDKKFAKGEDEIIGIQGLAAVPNGGSVVISDAEVAAWEEAHDMKVQDAFKDSDVVKVTNAADPKPEPEPEPVPNEEGGGES
jgi:hypothetical protein